MGRPVGAYGLRVRGATDRLLAALPEGSDWQDVTIARELGSGHHRGSSQISADTADIALIRGDRAVINRVTRSATLTAANRHDDGTLLHPFLTTVAVIFAWWDGRHAFHGGAFTNEAGEAWCVLGERGSGKSSTLAGLSLAGSTVFSDDLLVIRGGKVLVGPRCVDLRPEAAVALGVGEEVTAVRAGERCRLPLEAAPSEVSLGGWIFLRWGERLELRRLGPREWLERLSLYRSTATEGAPSLLELAGREAWELRRPRTWRSLEPAVERLRDLTGI